MGKAILGVMGWRFIHPFPTEPKLVMVSGPHTSNWDFVIMLCGALFYRVRIRVMAKDSLFRFPFGGFMRAVGCLPIDRSSPHGVVDQMIHLFAEHERLLLVIPASGTRGRRDHWRSGFYWVAHGAKVPIAMCYMDYPKREAGFKGLLYTTGDVAADMDVVRAAYADVHPKFPEKRSSIRLSDESGS